MRTTSIRPHHRRLTRAFTLIEMLVVIGIIGTIIALLLPALTKARAQANRIACMSNQRQIGIEMLIYAEDNNGYLFPPNLGWPTTGTPPIVVGSNPPQYSVWPFYVFTPHIWDPNIMLCPSDLDPTASHSYLANAELLAKSMDTDASTNPSATNDLRYSSPLPAGHTPSDVIVLGEKISSVDDYYMDAGEFSTKVEQYRHGLSVGSNYLMMDMHVETMVPTDAWDSLDPWNPYGSSTTQPSN